MNSRNGSMDEREEGEIIDDYEDIISSDEELTMRQRIEELEAKNAELEKIANISGVYGSGNYDYNRKESHPTDRYPLVSIDISDDEEFPPAPPMGSIIKRRKSSHSGTHRPIILSPARISSQRSRKKSSSSPPPAPHYRASDKLLLSMFHDRIASHSSSSHTSKRRRKSKKSHSTKTRRSRDYYMNDSDGAYNFDTYNVDFDDSYENYSDSDEDRTFPVNREELRVALARNSHRSQQHVSLKDRLIRRKENTDTLNETNIEESVDAVLREKSISCEMLCEDKEETEDDSEERELRIIALKSAVIRKHNDRKKRNENVAYSPSDFEEIYANMAISPSINNLDVTDAGNSMEISPVPSPKMIVSDDEGMDTKPVDMDIVNSESDCELPSYDKWVPIEQIPLPGNAAMSGVLHAPMPLRFDNKEAILLMPPEDRFKNDLASPVDLDSELDEEEVALRALLIAKMNSPKVSKVVKEEPTPKLEEVQTVDGDTSLEAEALRNLLISNMKMKSDTHSSSASVLKEAVRRLTARNSSKSPVDGFEEIPEINVTAPDSEIEVKPKLVVECDVEPKKTEDRPAVDLKEPVNDSKNINTSDGVKQPESSNVIRKPEATMEPRKNGTSIELVSPACNPSETAIPTSVSTIKEVPVPNSKANVSKQIPENKNSTAKGLNIPKTIIAGKVSIAPSAKNPPSAAPNTTKDISTVAPDKPPSKPTPVRKQPQPAQSKPIKPLPACKQGPTATKEIPPSSVSKVTVTQIKTAKPDKIAPEKPAIPTTHPKKPASSQKPPPPPPQPSSVEPAIPPRTKIVKPNKVINQQPVDLKRKSLEAQKTVVPVKKAKTEDVANTNRLITAADMPPVQKLVIQLRASDTESESPNDESDDEDDEFNTAGFLHKNIIIGNEYYDIDSPISLPMESPCDTPTGVASPAPTPQPQPIVAKSIVNDFFEAKLDQFLKTVRSKVAVSASPQVKKVTSIPAPVIQTPVAVRHLPEASQQEYRRLINRMKMLERQKQAKNVEIVVKNTTTTESVTESEVRIEKPEHQDNTTSSRLISVKDNTVIVEKTVKSNVIESKTCQKVEQIKPNLLPLYENSYRKAGTMIISNLEMNLKLVQEAKNAKKAKLKCEHRLRELRKEMEEIQTKLKEQQERITKTYPAIRSRHRVIESLKVKRGQISRKLTLLGRNASGPNYSINDEQKKVILEKSRRLAAEIKLVNTMKLSDIERWEATTNESSVQTLQNTQTTLNTMPSKNLTSSLNIEPQTVVIQTPPNGNQVPVSDSQCPQETTTATEIPVTDLAETEKNDESISEAQSQTIESYETHVPGTETVLREGDRDDCVSTNGHEEALAIEGVACDDKRTEDQMAETENEKEDDHAEVTDLLEEQDKLDEGDDTEEKEDNYEGGGAKLQDYISPLSHCRDERQINPNGILCPYELMGQCVDKDCKFMHLD